MSDDENQNAGSGGLDLFTNNHDLIGVEGIIRSQKNEIEKKKVTLYSPFILSSILYTLFSTSQRLHTGFTSQTLFNALLPYSNGNLD